MTVKHPAFANPLVAAMYAGALDLPDEANPDCGLTPLEHFIEGADGMLRIQSGHIHMWED